jgi:hypothetical protein
MMRRARLLSLMRRISRGPKLPIALAGAVAVALALTAVSVTWYSLDGSAKLDLSRPGYEQERGEVRTTETQKSYDTTSPVNKSAIDGFLKEYDQRVSDLSSYGDFGDGALDDNDIQLNAQSGNSLEQ